MFRILLLCLTVAIATAQNCIDNATPDASGKCQCDGGFAGNPDLCCFAPDNKKACYVAGDPVLSSFFGFKVGLDFPCATVLSSTRQGSCTVNVYASSNEVRSGVIYTSQVKVQLKTTEDDVSLTFNSGDVYTVVDNGASQTKALSSGPLNTAAGFVMVNYNANLKLVSVEACDSIVNFRPVIGTDPEQAGVPGVCIVANQAATLADPDQACALNSDLSGASLSEYLTSAIKPMQNYIFSTQGLSSVTSPQNAAKCNNFKNILANNCVFSDRESALKKCAFIVFQSLVRKCFYESSGNVMDHFLECLDTYCKGTKDTCDALMASPSIDACAANLKDCETWAPFRKNNRFVAGEGEEFNFGNEGDGGVDGGVQTTPGFLGSKDGILGGGNQGNNAGGNVGGVGTDDIDDFLNGGGF